MEPDDVRVFGLDGPLAHLHDLVEVVDAAIAKAAHRLEKPFAEPVPFVAIGRGFKLFPGSLAIDPGMLPIPMGPFQEAVDPSAFVDPFPVVDDPYRPAEVFLAGYPVGRDDLSLGSDLKMA